MDSKENPANGGEESKKAETGDVISVPVPEIVEPPPASVVSNSDIAALAEALEGKKSKEEDSDDDEAEIVEESPCGRWLKRREEVKYRDVPGVDAAYLAMDSEEGVEVVWNEAQFSTVKKFKAQEDKLKNVFEALTLIDHPNIVHFHRYWTDSESSETGEKKLPRLIFITEYMSSGSLKQFLRRTKKNNRKIQLQSWKRWCTQILSALSYLHQTCNPPIVHGNLTCDTIFIQHNGLVKIGSIAPDIIHQNVKTCRDNLRKLHYLAPEWGDNNATPGPPSDVYAFGMCALETAALDIQTNSSLEASASAPQLQQHSSSQQPLGQSAQPGQQTNAEEKPSGMITEEAIQRTIDQLEDELQKDFIRRCLRTNANERPTARELLFHPVLFEVHSLKLLAAHSLVNTPGIDNTSNFNEMMTDEAIQSHYGPDTIMATVTKGQEAAEYKLSNVPVAEKLEKFMEDVKFGIYPITAFALSQPPLMKTRVGSPESQMISEKSNQDVPVAVDDSECRRATQILASIGNTDTKGIFHLIIIARMEDCMNRQLTCRVTTEDGPENLANELIQERFLSLLDRPLVIGLLADVFRKLAVRSAKELADEIDSEVIETMPTAGLQNGNADNGNNSIKRRRTPEEIQQLINDSVFSRLMNYLPEQKDPKVAANLRDPTNVTSVYPMPEGSYFCPPTAEDGSVPFNVPPTGMNAFDCSHLLKQKGQLFHIEGGIVQTVFAPPIAASIQDKGGYDPFNNLQGAQKVLEGISAHQLQQQHQQMVENTEQFRKEEDQNKS